MASLNGKTVKGQARARILSMNLMRRLPNTFLIHVYVCFSFFAALFNNIASFDCVERTFPLALIIMIL